MLRFGLDVRVPDRGGLIGQPALGGSEHGISPAPERADLVRCQSELFADHDARQGECELRHELAATAADERVDELIADSLDVGDHLPHPAW